MIMQKRLLNIKNILRTKIPKLSKEYNIKTMEIFGSYGRDEQTPSSDIDLLVTFSVTPSLLKFIALENYLTDLLNIKVDLVIKSSLKPRLSKRILSEVVQI